MLRLLCVFVLLQSAAPILANAESSQSYPITTLINAKWTQTPLYLEIAEYLADEQAGLFWDYVRGVTKLDTALNEYDTESQMYNAALETGSRLIENNTRTVVLYADLGSAQFRSYHKLLEQEANNGKIRYILRHHLAKKEKQPVRLSGYGVELHLKSTEYKSQDDAPKPEAGSTLDEDLDNESDVHGFDFKVLKNKHPTLKRALDQLRQRLLQGNDEIAQLKAWEFQDLGLQATAAIAEIQGDETLQILQYTAHNFPMLARTLLAHKVTETLRAEVKHNTDTFGRSLNVAPPDGALFINGLFFDADTMDLYSMGGEPCASEMRVLESLHSNNVRGRAWPSSLLAPGS
ncbi:GL24886 [Drosophila persimilis]|uniref:GL24886 n=1 Tax=Drosophila persimilis TaxID=7234 RepID=B4GRR4_DROPE|nr:GL24886 [Drosophila persimilis]